jgi:uncharacterized protein (TIGR02145 family)
MLKTHHFLLAASLALALAFTFSCSGDDSGNDLPPPSSSSDTGTSQPSSSSLDPCALFIEGEGKLHYGMEKKEFCDKRDGNIYAYVKIGTQTWMAENLNHFVAHCGKDNGCTANDQEIKSSKCAVANDGFAVYEDNMYCKTYGRLYTPAAAFEVCPQGWHLPSYEEWLELIEYAGDIDPAIKLRASSRWSEYFNGLSTDEFGFSALPAGYIPSDGRINSLGAVAYWLSSTLLPVVNGTASNGVQDVRINGADLQHGLPQFGTDWNMYASVPCVKN